jgi:hypothetical protein
MFFFCFHSSLIWLRGIELWSCISNSALPLNQLIKYYLFERKSLTFKFAFRLFFNGKIPSFNVDHRWLHFHFIRAPQKLYNPCLWVWRLLPRDFFMPIKGPKLCKKKKTKNYVNNKLLQRFLLLILLLASLKK